MNPDETQKFFGEKNGTTDQSINAKSEKSKEKATRSKNRTPKPKPPKLSGILEEAERLVTGDRDQQYGNQLDSFTHIADIWTAILRRKLSSAITPEEVTLLMIGLKMARLIVNPSHRDSLVDIAGYAKCNEQVQEQAARRSLEAAAKVIKSTTKDLNKWTTEQTAQDQQMHNQLGKAFY